MVLSICCFGLFWVCFWLLRVVLGLFWVCFGLLRVVLGLFWVVLGYFELFWIFLGKVLIFFGEKNLHRVFCEVVCGFT